MAQVEIILLLIAACLGFALLARRLGVPYAVILVLGGMVLALLPGMPEVSLDPELALAFFLPPLLQASAFRTDPRAFRRNLRAILFLAVGAVIFTAFAVAVVVRWLLPDLPWAAAVALGAIVAPPDAVAAAAVLQRLRLPRRIVTILEGESLMNDASALVVYRLAVTAAAGGGFFVGEGALSFVVVGGGGLLLGAAMGVLLVWAMQRIDDPMIETSASFLGGYAAYLAAEMLDVSPVLAVVVLGLVLGRAQHTAVSSRTRLVAVSVWQFVEFILNSLVFILIGLQLNHILGRLAGIGVWQLTGLALAVSAAVIVSRFVWVFPATLLPRLVPSIRRVDPLPPWRQTVIVGWAGMRGVVSLAVAIALPLDFPQRDLLVFLAFAAILATLVVQGTTLEWLIRRLGVEEPAQDGGIDPEEAEARRAMAAASLAEIERRLDDPLEGAIAGDIVAEFRDHAGHLHRIATNRGAAAAERAARRRLRLAALEAARDRLIAQHRTGELSEEGLIRLEQELDLEEMRVRATLGDERTAAERREEEERRRLRGLRWAAHA